MTEVSEKTSENLKEDTKKLLIDSKFKDIYLKQRERIYWYIFKKVNNTEITEDFTADVFLKLYENWSSVEQKGKSAFLPWLYTVARNLVIDHYRKAANKHKRSIEDEEIDDATKVYSDFVSDAIKEENLKLLKNSVNVLDDDERELLRLRFQEDLNFRDIGEIIKKNEGACKMALYRIIQKLKLIMSDNLKKGNGEK
ncbi:sigma-70 family RNA polymerase sigma factor [Candidatus Dojkabacteria bacterium]|nr:sigma-70 family RNA polymerase sigma factor [Candidatus Dojkabacteria bacterium]